jgi:aminoglycoside 6'-N-acetyltransferase
LTERSTGVRFETGLSIRAIDHVMDALEANGLGFRLLRDEDLPLLQVWLSRPHIAKWWRQPLDLDGVRTRFGPSIRGIKPTHVYVIEWHSAPVGWIQWYRWSNYREHAARIGAEPNTAGIDLAIGEPELLGQGIGTRVIGTFLKRWVFAEPDIAACITDPDERNLRSIRALEKAGFVMIRSVYDPVQLRTSHVMQATPTALVPG